MPEADPRRPGARGLQAPESLRGEAGAGGSSAADRQQLAAAEVTTPAGRPSEQVQRLSLDSVVAGLLVVLLGLWLLERGQEPTHLIWAGVAVIIGPWIPTIVYRLALLRRWSTMPEVQILDIFGPVLGPAVAAHGMAPVLEAVRGAIASLGVPRVR